MNTTNIYKSPQGEKIMMEFYDRMLGNWPVEHVEADVVTKMGSTHMITAGAENFPPLVLLHGSTSNATTWAGDIAVYSQFFRVYAIDMPGEPGKSFQSRLSWENDEYCEWLLELFDAMNLHKVTLVGLSLGGWAAQKFTSMYPERVSKLALIAPGGVVNPNMKAIFKMIKYSSEGEKGVDKTLKLLFPDDFESPEVKEFFTLINKHFIIRTEAVKTLPDDALAGITVPAIMICGANDCIFNFKKAKKRFERLIPHSKVLLFEKGSHGMVNMGDAIIPFLKS